MRKFGEKIKELRVTQDLGLFDTARILGIATDSLNRIERGEEDPPSPEVVRALAKLLAADPEDLLRLRRLCQQLAVLQPNLRGVFELLLEACASSHDDRDLSDEQVTRIEQFIRREVLMSIENLVPSTINLP